MENAVAVNDSLKKQLLSSVDMAKANEHPCPADLLAWNKKWAARMNATMPGFFKQSAEGQHPKVMWVGCADSRVPEGVVTESLPGSIFTHRNIANQYRLSDASALAAVAYAVDHAHSEHVIVVGHTGCGGIAAAIEAAKGNKDKNPDIANWIEPLVPLVDANPGKTVDELVVLNVKQQVQNLAQKLAGKKVLIHGWLYTLDTGFLSDLKVTRAPEPVQT